MRRPCAAAARAPRSSSCRRLEYAKARARAADGRVRQHSTRRLDRRCCDSRRAWSLLSGQTQTRGSGRQMRIDGDRFARRRCAGARGFAASEPPRPASHLRNDTASLERNARFDISASKAHPVRLSTPGAVSF